MLKLIPKVVLLVALLATLVISSAPAFASGGCQFDKKTGQCVTAGCKDGCISYGLLGCYCLGDKGF